MPATVKSIEVSDSKSYSSTRLAQMGIGKKKLATMRRSGIVKARNDGGFLVYLGKEINRYYEQLPIKEI
jgi:hypothetical protein